MSKIVIKAKKGDLPKHRNYELNQSLITCGYRVIQGKKKLRDKYNCRGNIKW